MTKNIAKGFLLSATYCASFLLAWQLSVDQWYLPAGLRVATLLFLPYRLWPYLLLGDAAGLILINVTVVHGHDTSLFGAYAISFLMMPCVALIAHAARHHIGRLQDHECLLLPLTLAFALWSTLCSIVNRPGFCRHSARSAARTLQATDRQSLPILWGEA
ncbi:MASE1 domain-containing protein [Xanthomonas albilineans]|uniref:MASE1 domain-containing protein n=1 Tax=Xanthomonas albilineans TaxID=29447 RepID=UPI0009BA7A2A